MPSLICIISPAKSLAANIGMLLPITKSLPSFLDRTEDLVQHLRSVKAAEFKKMMSISDVIASRTREEYQVFEMQGGTAAASTQAGLLFDGPAYRGLCCAALSPADMQRCQQNVRFLSGLYGWLRPGDFIQAHRLEMGTKGLPLPASCSSLYQYWAAQLVSSLLAELQPPGGGRGAYGGMLLNCASEEYFKVIDKTALAAACPAGRAVRIVTCAFTDKGRVLSVYAKRARGLMARFVSTDAAVLAAMQHAEKEGGAEGAEAALLAALKTFSLEGYAFTSMTEDPKSGAITLHYDRAGAPPQPPNPVPRAAKGSAMAVYGGGAAEEGAAGAGAGAGAGGAGKSGKRAAEGEEGEDEEAAATGTGRGRGKPTATVTKAKKARKV